ncbi:hypothetical protein ACJ2CR_19420 [Myxococcus faecalis]|uniref:ORC-CDC6 family AAA ATPase n=1 Tax=Myxococcus faecalis TaxID=3115646 RepID=UPI0038CFF7B2
MKDVRNPFRLQTAESIDSEGDFLRLFGHGVLDLLPADALSGRPLFIRSAPGGGKTSLLKLFTPSVLQHLLAMKGNEAVKDLINKLKALGAISEQEIKVLSVMLPCARTFPALADVGLKAPRAKRLLLALIDARIILGALRATLIARRLRFPDDLARLTLRALPDEQIPDLSFPCNGSDVQRWAERVEQGVCDIIDELMPTDGSGPSGHDSLLSLRLLDANSILLDGNPVESRWLVTFDDMQKLAAAQRTALLEVVVEQRSRSTVWMAERFEALTTDELLGSGALSGRDGEVIALEHEWKEKRRFEPAVRVIAERRARMAADSAGANAPDSFAPTINAEADLEAPIWQSKTHDALDVVRKRVEALTQGKPQYAEWVKSRTDADGSLREQLINWRALEILIERHTRKRQLALVLEPLSRDELVDKDGADVRGAAELFLSKEFGFPFYFGFSRLASLASFNVEQFIRLAGDLFEESLAAAIMRRPPNLSPDRQERILGEAYDARVLDLPRRAKNGREVLTFIEAVGQFCNHVTHQPNAPYSPGINGIAISMQERKTLIDPKQQAQNPALKSFAELLGTALAHNILHAELDYKVKGNTYMVLYLNRLLCPKFQLPLGFGSFRERPLRELMTWADKGFRPSKTETLL